MQATMESGHPLTRLSLKSFLLFVLVIGVCGVSELAVAQNVMRATNTSGIPGFFIDSTVEFDTVEDIQGWSFGVCHDPLELDAMSATIGADAATVNGGSSPDFMAIDVLGTGVTMAVIISGSSSNVLPAGTNHEILNISYEVVGGPPGDMAITTDLQFCDTLGAPPVESIVVVAGIEQTPTFVNGTVTIDPPPDFCLELTCTGGQDAAQLDWLACSPFDYFLIHRNGVLIDTLPTGSNTYTDPTLPPGTYHYAIIGVVFPNPLGTPVILVDECDADIIPIVIDSITPDNGTYLGGTEVTVTGRGFDNAMFPTTVHLDGVLQTMVTVVNDTMLTFFTEPASMLGVVDLTVTNIVAVTVPDAYTYGFLRGDSNEDNTLDVADSVYTLTYLFQGGPPPTCFDAADTNDDGGVDIGDPVYGLTFLFAMGTPPPPPFIPDLGDDPTPDALGCI